MKPELFNKKKKTFSHSIMCVCMYIMSGFALKSLFFRVTVFTFLSFQTSLHLFQIVLIQHFNFFISESQTDTRAALFVSAQPRQAGSSYLPCGVEGSVSNIHGCEAIKSWCDYRGIINVRTETSKNINLYS